MFRISKEELVELYVNQKLSLLEIARQYGYANESCIAYIRYRYGIPSRPLGELKRGKHYSQRTELKPGIIPWNTGLTSNTDPRILTGNHHPKWNMGLSKETDARVLAQSRKVSQTLKGSTHKDAQYAFGREFYGKLYWGEGLSLQSIADKLGCDMSTVYHYFKKYQIPRRKAFEAQRRKPTAPELRLTALIEKHGLGYRYVGNGAVWFEGYNPDFINIDGAKVIIELFGDYWHTTKIKKWRETESGRTFHFAKFGFKTLILWENELKNEKTVVKKIKAFTEGLKEVL